MSSSRLLAFIRLLRKHALLRAISDISEISDEESRKINEKFTVKPKEDEDGRIKHD